MSYTIWKFKLSLVDCQVIPVPATYRFLSAQLHWDEICVWVMVNPEMPTANVGIRIYATGEVIPEEPGHYIGTVQQHSGQYVWHLFNEGVQV